MRRDITTGFVWCALALSTGAQAQSFQNLDFESAVVVSNDPDFGFLSWDLAVPHWTHGTGGDSGSVYHGLHHVGLTPRYLLIDSGGQGFSPLQGEYSLAFANGRADAQSEDSPWLESFIAQQGLVSDSARSLRILATGPVEVRVNGVSLSLQTLGLNEHGADISVFAGQTVELRLSNRATELHDPVVIDGIQFSSASLVPEPTAPALVLMGLGSLFATLRREQPAAQGINRFPAMGVIGSSACVGLT